MAAGKRVAILGASGAVGQELVKIFESRRFPVEKLKLLASPRSSGKTVAFNGNPVAIEAVEESCFEDTDIAFFSAGASRSKQWAPIAIAAGARVIDNSSAFRMDDQIPLVVPEINGNCIGNAPLIAVPNCTAILLTMALEPLRRLSKIERVTVSTYQSASGAGAAAMEELENQTHMMLHGMPAQPEVFPHPIAFNLFSHNTAINEFGYNDEEWKVIHETRKILGISNLKVGVTCVRVPIPRAHTETVIVEFSERAPTEQAVRQALEEFPGVSVMDDRENNYFPMPIDASGNDDVLVGRIRKDYSHDNAIAFMLSGDQLRKGAALNAVQIAEQF